MSEQDCGSCDHQGDINHPQKKVECLIDGEWHERGYACEDFKEYVQGKTSEERISEARDIRRRKDAKAAEQREIEFAEKMAQKDREHDAQSAQLKMKHDAELQKEKMKHDKKLWWATVRWQLILAFVSAVLGFGVGWILKP